MLKKLFFVLICSAFFVLTLTGCSEKEKEESSEESFYGQTIKEVDGKEIYLIYDGNFISDEEMDTLVNYYNAIQNKDYELFESTQPEEYLNFLKDTTDVKEYVDSENSSIENELGEGFDFLQIEVTDCIGLEADTGQKDIKEMLDNIYSDAGKEKSFSDTIKDEKYIVYDIKAQDKNGERYDLTQQSKYIFTCEDGIYIL